MHQSEMIVLATIRHRLVHQQQLTFTVDMLITTDIVVTIDIIMLTSIATTETTLLLLLLLLINRHWRLIHTTAYAYAIQPIDGDGYK